LREGVGGEVQSHHYHEKRNRTFEKTETPNVKSSMQPNKRDLTEMWVNMTDDSNNGHR